MTAPTWAQHEMTYRTGSGALPESSIPAYLRQHASAPGRVEGGLGGLLLWSASSRLAVWMCRNRRAGLPLAVVLGALCTVGAALLWNPVDPALWLVAWLWAWLAVKFTAVGIGLAVARLREAARPVR